MREGADGFSRVLLSAGSDNTFRFFNTAVETQNIEMSQKVILKKVGLLHRSERLSRVIGFDSCETRRRDWGDIVTIHSQSCSAYVWKSTTKAATDIILKQSHWATNVKANVVDKKTFCSAVAISSCGNFAVIGYKGGFIYTYNIQSGQYRGSYPYQPDNGLSTTEIKQRELIPGNVLFEMRKIQEEEQLGKQRLTTTVNSVPAVEVVTGHSEEVTGVFIDVTNMILVSCGLG
jgi:U3 small nucleolar RNA-associated protein 21